MMYGLSDETVKKINGVLTQFPEVEMAILYGSRAKGNYKTGSDIDLTLMGTALTTNICGTIELALDDLLLPYTIDLSLFASLRHPELREHIERVGIVFYDRNWQMEIERRSTQMENGEVEGILFDDVMVKVRMQHQRLKGLAPPLKRGG